jgi:hypothetical protein
VRWLVAYLVAGVRGFLYFIHAMKTVGLRGDVTIVVKRRLNYRRLLCVFVHVCVCVCGGNFCHLNYNAF